MMKQSHKHSSLAYDDDDEDKSNAVYTLISVKKIVLYNTSIDSEVK